MVTQINEVKIEQDKRAMDASSRPRVSCLVKYIIVGKHKGLHDVISDHSDMSVVRGISPDIIFLPLE